MKEMICKAHAILAGATLVGMTMHAVGFFMIFVDAREKERQEILEYIRTNKNGGVN